MGCLSGSSRCAAARYRSNVSMGNDITERLDRLQAEVSQLRELAIMQTAMLQVMAIKQGIAPAEYQAVSAVPIPTPFDLMAMLKPRD